MIAMKLVFLLLVPTVAGNSLRQARVAVTPQDIEECESRAKLFLKEPAVPAAAIEDATDYCAIDKKVDDKNYVCPHVKEGLQGAFARLPEDKKLSVSDFCEVSEAYFIGLRGATRVPNAGSGPIINFDAGRHDCRPAVRAALNEEKSLAAAHVPDFWYAMCLNQDCAHFLPSRTRWCNVDKQPTHGVEVCTALRKFATDETTVLGAKEGGYGPKALCDMYEDFVKEMGQDVEAYEHFIHIDTRHRIETPHDKKRALKSSQLTNDAAAHSIRDNAGSPPRSGSRQAAHLLAGPLTMAVALLSTLYV